MEVHHHSETARQKWTPYFRDFEFNFKNVKSTGINLVTFERKEYHSE